MKSIFKRCIVYGAALLMGSTSMNGALTKDFYKAKSVLSAGNWVRVGVDRTGVYEISYETLRQMGFANPDKVGIYGRGGRVMPESFTTTSGEAAISDDLQPVKVLHENNKIYFYGLGPEEITFTSSADYSTGGYFSRKSNNIYSKRGYYFLTDATEPELMPNEAYKGTVTNEISKGVSYIYHELDSLQNTTNSGQLFWGEQIGLPDNPKRSWSAKMPDAIKGSDGVMECHLYMQDNANFIGSKVSYGFTAPGINFFTTNYTLTGSLVYSPHEPKIGKIQVPGTKGTVFVGLEGQKDMTDFCNLDFWVVSYERTIPTLRGADNENLNQQLIALPDIKHNSSGRLKLNDCVSFLAFDVTNPSSPKNLEIRHDGPTGILEVSNNGSVPQVVIFDKDVPQLQICGYEANYSRVANQNLHALKDQGADFIIISTPRFREYAERIADLHRTHDNIVVAVATTEELYNEFSAGVPDPMAYRSFAKMLYFSEKKPKNMLLLGPLYSDFRGLHAEHNPFEGIIAFQSPQISVSRGAHNINDFYGMMEDQFNTDYYERNPVHIAVAILPVLNETDAGIVTDKIKRYLERTDYAYYLNRYTAVGGVGDAHTHDIQMRDINTFIRQLDNYGTLFTPISIDTYGYSEARNKFINKIHEGCGMLTYFGHGAEQFLGKNNKFFNSGDVFKLRNEVLPFAGFGGCQITNTDRGNRGLGESIVTSTPYGCIGALVSARETWSGQNMEFFKQFFICLYKQGQDAESPHRTEPVTIGEVYSKVKHYSTYNNELAYQLICDPALIYPSIVRSITVQANMPEGAKLLPGEKFKMTGYITNNDNTTDEGFNGQVVVRVNEPEKLIPAGAIESNEHTGSLQYYYRDEQVGMAVADVKDGKFEIEVHIPAYFSTFKDQKSLLYFSAYDPSTKTGAGKCYTVPILDLAGGSTESKDNISPVIEQLAFNTEDCSISIAVSDNVALNLSSTPLNKGLYLYIDGKERSEAHFAQPILEPGRAAYSKKVNLEALSVGQHSARLKVKDMAGNVSESEIIFTYQPLLAKYSIQRSEDSNPESTVIEANGNTPVEARVVVISTSGQEVWRGEFKNGRVEWNHLDSRGNRVAPGHYKAYILETGVSSNKGHSETIDIPVI